MTKIRKSIIIFLSLFIILPLNAQQNTILDLETALYKTAFSQQSNFDIKMDNYNVIYQNLHFTIDPQVYYIGGEVAFYYQALRNIDSLILNLSDSLRVDSIKQNNKKLLYVHRNNLLRINIDNINTSSIDSVFIYYRGEPSSSNNAFFIGVQDSIDYIPVLATLSEPYGSSDWWPCKNNLSDKIDSIDIVITCPIGNKAVSLGILEKVETNALTTTYHWKHRYPITPYLVAISVSDYSEYHKYIHYGENDSILFLNYLYQNNLDAKINRIDLTESFVNVYDSLFMPYPFAKEKYGHVEFPIGGGMEHQTISSMGSFNYEIISHELAHQWFGDYITCGSWEDLWLNEGFATYCTGLCYENIRNGYWWPIWKAESIRTITREDTGSVFPTDTNLLSRLFDSRLTYRKASYVLHMIRWTIGDDNFFEAIRNYLQNKNLAFAFAKTPDLITQFEQQADTSLETFMNDWFYGEGYPIFHIEWSQDQQKTCHIHIDQHSVLNDGHIFRLFIPLRIWSQNKPIDLKLNLQDNQQSYHIELDCEVDSILFDPDSYLISKNSWTRKINYDHIRIFPNPCKNDITIETIEEIQEVQLININGKILNIEYFNHHINTKYLASGIYILQIQTRANVYLKKIVKY